MNYFLRAIPRVRTLCIVHREVWSNIGSEDFTFCFSMFASCFLFPLLWYEVAMPFCFLPQMPWWLLLIIRVRDLPFSVSIQWTHIYQVPALHLALCRVGAWRPWDEWRHSLHVHASESAWLYLPGLFFFFNIKTSLFLYPISCYLSSSVCPLFYRNVLQHVFFDFSVSISFDLASVLL